MNFFHWPIWEKIGAFLNTNFSAAFFGACAGALAAHLIATRGARKNELLREVRATDAAISLVINVIMRSLAIKMQHLAETVGSYKLRRTTAHAYFHDANQGRLPPGTEINIELDLKRLDPLLIPAQRLEEVVLGLNLRGRIPQLAITIHQCWDSMNRSIDQRNVLVDEFSKSDAPEKQKALKFFGLPYKARSVDTSFGETLEAIGRQNDDCLWFGRALCRELEKRALVLREAWRKARYRGELSRVFPADFSKPEAAGLFPPDSDYSDWETAFVMLPARSRGRHCTTALYCVRKNCRWAWRAWR